MCPLETYSYNDQQHLVLDRDSASFPLMIMNSAMSALNTLQLYSRLQSLSKRLPTTWLIIHIIHAFLVPGITRFQNIAAFNTWLVEAWLAGIQSILITKVTTIISGQICHSFWPSFVSPSSKCFVQWREVFSHPFPFVKKNPNIVHNISTKHAICDNQFNTCICIQIANSK